MTLSVSEIAQRLTRIVIGQERVVAQFSQALAGWQSEKQPRFPLRVLVAGPSGVGKQLLATTIANEFFGGQLISHSFGQLRQNRRLVDSHGHVPRVVFLRWFDTHEEGHATIDLLLSSGGIILGNGRTVHLADSLVFLSCTQSFSARHADERSASQKSLRERVTAEYPWTSTGLDAFFQLNPLSGTDLSKIVDLTTEFLSRQGGFPMVVLSEAAKQAIVAKLVVGYGGARDATDDVASLISNVKERDISDFERQVAQKHQLLIDHSNGNYSFRWSKRSVAMEAQPSSGSALKFDEPSPFDPNRRPSTFPALHWREAPAFDVFISYKTRKYQAEARRLYAALVERGIKVWFDEECLNRGAGASRSKSKTQLIRALTEGVARSRCTVCFEAELEAVPLPPEVTASNAMANGDVMLSDEGALVAWNWQKLELDSSSRLITVHAKASSISVAHDGRNITRAVLGEDASDLPLFDALILAIEHFRNVKPSPDQETSASVV